MAVTNLMIAVVVMAIASLRLPSAVAQTRHLVGGNTGWGIPMNGNINYTTWAAGQTFAVGDTLVFNFAADTHDVAEVNETAFAPCTTANPISLITTAPPVTVNLTTPGNHYFICTYRSHCSLGQKFAITVAESNSTAPVPAGSMTPPPAGGMTPPSPPAPSSASSFSAVVPVAFLAAALGFFY